VADEPIGYAAVVAELGITDYIPVQRSYVSARAYARAATPLADRHGRMETTLPGRTAVDRSVGGQLLAAFKHDGVDLEALRLVLPRLAHADVQRTVAGRPSSAPARQLWFFYEWMIGKTLDVPSQERTRSVPLLDPERYITCSQGRSSRHGIEMKMLGTGALCPQIRRTPLLASLQESSPLTTVATLASGMDARLRDRINGYLLGRESKGSYRIEGIEPQATDDEEFFKIIAEATRRPMQPIEAATLHRWQDGIIGKADSSTTTDYRTDQVWLGHRRADHVPVPVYIPPKAEDVPELMAAFCPLATWLNDQAERGNIDPVAVAAATSATFVYIHPYMDGNGRLSRVLMQQSLRAPGGEKDPLLLPISSAIHRHQQDYYQALESWSSPVMRRIEHAHNGKGGVYVTNDTAALYRYPDITKYAEFVYGAAQEAAIRDVPEEQATLATYDRMEPVMSDAGITGARAALLFRVLKQNDWNLAARKRALFSDVTPEVLAELRAAAGQVPRD